MKIWVTRDTAGSIHGGGLERLHVWFRQPQWVEYTYGYDSPFDDQPLRGNRVSDWVVLAGGSSGIGHNYSFGKLFGYNDRREDGVDNISVRVWRELCLHFGCDDIYKWQRIEDEGIAERKNFIVELDIMLKLISQKTLSA